MNLTTILAELRTRRTRIDHAISALVSLNHPDGFMRGRGAKRPSAPKRRGRMSAAARAKLSALMRERWAQRKIGKKATVKLAQTSGRKRRISAAGRKRIVAATKRRWAEWRRAQKKPVAKVA